jgi:hypothetical protein
VLYVWIPAAIVPVLTSIYDNLSADVPRQGGYCIAREPFELALL